MGALDGIQVIDLTTGTAGPLAAAHLADHGAEVVKVEAPGGDPARSNRGFGWLNRGKRSVVLAPEAASGPALRALLAGADVCLLPRADSLAAYGVDRRAILDDNPGLVLATVPVWPGPAPWAGDIESNGLLSASLGIAWRQVCYDGGPVEPVTPMLLYVHAAWAATCVVAALVSRLESGHGQELSVSAVNACQVFNIGAMSMRETAPEPRTDFGPAGRHPTYTRFECADGVWITSGALGERMERAFLGAVGLTSILADPRIGDDTGQLIAEANVDWVSRLIQERMRERQSADWLDALGVARVPTGLLARPGHWLDDEQVQAIGMRVRVDDPERGPFVMPGSPLFLEGTPGDATTAAPILGSTEVAAITRPARPRPDGRPPLRTGPLAGHQVLSLGTFVALPYSGGLLADLGADVIRVEPTTGDPFRERSFHFTRGTRSCALDLKQPEGRRALHALLGTAGVVMNGLRPGTAPHLGVDHATLAAQRDDVITVTLSAYGDRGPRAHLGGVDMVIQGESGLMHRQGGSDEPVITTIAAVDIATAALLALTTTLALYHRGATGEGQRTWCALAATAAYLQGADLVTYDGAPAPAIGGEDFRGPDAWHRFYRCSDGWIRIDTEDPDAAAMARAAIDVDIHADMRGDAEVDALAKAFAGRSAGELAASLNAAGIACVTARRITSAVRDPVLVAEEFVHVTPAGDGGFNLLPGRLATFSRTPRVGPQTTPGPGEHTVATLSAAGLTSEDIGALVAQDAARVGGPIPQVLSVVTYR